MNAKDKKRASLEECLQTVSDVLFPPELGKKIVTLNSQDVDGDTPLHVFASRKDRYAVKLCIDAGANIDAVGDMGETPLHIAIARGSEGIVELLLEAGAKTSIRSEFNETALEKAQKKSGPIEKMVKQYAGA